MSLAPHAVAVVSSAQPDCGRGTHCMLAHWHDASAMHCDTLVAYRLQYTLQSVCHAASDEQFDTCVSPMLPATSAQEAPPGFGNCTTVRDR